MEFNRDDVVTEAVAWLTACAWNDASAQHLVLDDVVNGSRERRTLFLLGVVNLTALFLSQSVMAAGRYGNQISEWQNVALDNVSGQTAFRACAAVAAEDTKYVASIVSVTAESKWLTGQLSCSLGTLGVAAASDLSDARGSDIFQELGRWGASRST